MLRLNPEVAPETVPGFAVRAPASNFGMTCEEILTIAGGGTLAGPSLRLRGIHAHVASDLTGVGAICDPGVGAPGRWAATGLLDTDLERPVCESTHSLGRHVLPALDRGDLVAIDQAGAYGASPTSRYRGRPWSAEVLLWLDGSLQPCERPSIIPVAVTPVRVQDRAARPPRPAACHTVGSATVVKESPP